MEPAVFLSSPDLTSRLSEIQRIKVYGRDDGAGGLPRVWQDFLRLPRHTLPRLLKEIGLRHSTAHLRYGDAWKLAPRPLDVGPSWEDRLAKRDDGLARGERAARREYQVLQGIHHRGIAEALDIRDHQGGPAILFGHRESDLRLDHYLDNYGDQLAPEVRQDMVRQLAEAVRYAHHRSLYHRAFAPRSVFVSARGDGTRPQLRITDWQTAARDFDATTSRLPSIGDSTLDPALIEDAAQPYLAPETDQPYADPADLDVFGLGAVAYLIVTGQAPATQRSALLERLRADGGLHPYAVSDGVAEALGTLVFDSTRTDVNDRLESADRFLDLLDAAEQEAAVPEEAGAAQVDPLDALPGQPVDGDWSVRRVLGTGATSRALLVGLIVTSSWVPSHRNFRCQAECR